VGPVTFESIREAVGEKDKIACLHALLAEVAQKRLAVSDGVDTLLEVMETETSPSVRYTIWMLFVRGVAHEGVHALARRTLEDPDAAGRGKAAAYLVQFHPSENGWLVEHFLTDGDPELTFNLGRALLASDRPRAVRAWLACLDATESLSQWEVTSEYVAAYGDMENFEDIMRRHIAMGAPYSTWLPIADMILARHHDASIAYTCPECSEQFWARRGAPADELRCRKCGHTPPLQ